MTSTDISSAANRMGPTPYVAALDEIAALDQQIAALSAVRAHRVHTAWQHLLDQAPRDTSTGGPAWSPERVARVEFLTELAVFTYRTEYRTSTLIDTALTLVDRLPKTLAGLHAGTLSWEHAEVIAKHATGLIGDALNDDALADYDTRMASLAAGLSPKKLEYRARAQVELSQPATAVERVQRAVKTRRVFVDPGKDGMAYLTLFAPAPEVYAIANRADRLAAGLKNAGDPRSLTHLRVDVLSDLLLNGETSIPGATRGIRGRVHLTVPAMTIFGIGDEATILRGYGPIDPATAAQLTAEATSWRRILTDPTTGRILKLNPTDYRPTQQMRDHARLVHPACVFPGCTDNSAHADIDHTEDFANGGLTEHENLAPLAPQHHRVKHHTSWQITQDNNDTLTWTSPAGLQYTAGADGTMQPAPPALFEAAKQNEVAHPDRAEEPCPF